MVTEAVFVAVVEAVSVVVPNLVDVTTDVPRLMVDVLTPETYEVSVVVSALGETVVVSN